MAIVPGYEHDMFVSYAHLDNQPLSAAQRGWVHTLVDKLESEVRQRLGRKNFRIWIDREIDENHPLTDEITEAITRSAMLLVILSPGYLHSEWCKRERNAFLTLLKDRIRDGCVFVLECRHVERKELPPEFGDLLPFQFWALDPDSGADRPLGIPDPYEQKFVQSLNNLSHKIKKQVEFLSTMRADPPRAQAELGVREAAPYVYVAHSTDDVEERETELKSYLTQAGINVLPQTRYPESSADAFEAALLKDLERCKLFVQLLGASRGRELDFARGKRLPRYQNELAIRSTKPTLLWRDRGLDIDSVTNAEHRALLDSARACNIEEFKRAVIDEARRDPPVPSRPKNTVMAFVNADSLDMPLALEVGNALARCGVECYWPLAKGLPESIRKDLEENLKNCDGLMLIYGAAGPEWVRSQLRQSRKVIAQRERPLAALAVFEGPPPEKDDIAAAIPKLVTLNCRSGLDVGALKKFVEALDR